ncbi:MAG TPA: Ig-like domain-containing protein [Longimicrobium sp.]|nr:Ig-like domain-containing protein [Longimicrobium sp.]
MGALAVLLAACNGDGTGTSGPASVVAITSTSQVGVVGAAVAQPPAVRVTDRQGAPMAGVSVLFAVTGGGGILSTTHATTNADGTASAGTWTLGAAPGQNTATATVTDLAPVQFVATAQPRIPTTILRLAPITQTAPPGTPVPAPPRVRVVDQLAQPLPGVTVTWTVTAGGGTVGNPTAVTDGEGIATSGSWTMGPNVEQNTLSASVTGLTSVTFTAIPPDPCQTFTPYTPLTTLAGTLTSADCRASAGYYVDFYRTTLASAQAITLRMSSSQVNSWLEFYDAEGDILAVSDDVSDTSTDAAINVFAPSGNYFLAATTFDPNELGAYTLSSAAFTGAVDCGEYWVVPGITLNGTVASTDCEADGYYSDLYFLILKPGQQLTVRMESTAFDALLELYDAVSGQLVAENDDGGGGNTAQIVYTASGLSIFAINATTFDTGSTGGYTLTITSTGGDRTAALRADQLPAGLLDAARDRSAGRKAAPAMRGAGSRAPLLAPTPRVKRTGTR